MDERIKNLLDRNEWKHSWHVPGGDDPKTIGKVHEQVAEAEEEIRHLRHLIINAKEWQSEGPFDGSQN